MADLIAELNSALEGRYSIERKLGEGGMATVFLANDSKHERKVALKVLKPELAAVVGADRFLAEIKTTANLQHPNILPLFDSGQSGGFVYYVMPYMEGESLRDRLDRERQLPIPDATRIATDVAEALDYAHRQGVIHRDIKPANVLLGDGKPMVADFGIALAVGAAGKGRLTETGLSLGTPHYMSPEQATGDQLVGQTTDVYSLGCVLYEMLVGEPPHTGSTPQAILGKIIAGEVEPVTKQRPATPPHVDAAIRRSLEPVPADRFPRASGFAAALADTGFRHERGVGIYRRADSPVWKQVTILSVALSLILALCLGWLLTRSDPPTPVTRVSVKAPGAQVYSGGLALSPDGSFLVYSAEGPGDQQDRLWIRRWDSFDARPVEGSEGAIFPEFSPDGEEIAFCSSGGVRVGSVQGGEPRTIASGALAGVAWSTDGDWVYFADYFTGLKRVPAGGGPVERITAVDTAAGERAHAAPHVLPGDNAVLFAIVGSGGIEMAAVDLGSGEVKTLGPGISHRYSPTGHLVFIDEGGSLLSVPFDAEGLETKGPAVPLWEGMAMANPPRGWFSFSENGTLVYLAGGASDNLTPVWVERDGTVVEVDPNWRTTGLVHSVAISPGGDRAAISVQDSAGAYHLWVKGLDNGPFTRVTFEGSMNLRATWSRDGQYLRFLSNRASWYDLWMARADGSGSAQLLLDRDATLSQGFFSPDGTWLVFAEDLEGAGGTGIFAIRPAVDSVPVPIVVRPGFSASASTLSPDGRWIAYSSDESGQEEVYVRPFPDADSGQWQVSIDGGTEPVWAHSGRELFYKNAAEELVAVQMDEGPGFGWTRQDVLFSAADFLSRGPHHLYDVSPDDRRFLMFGGYGESPWELILVQGFFEELNRLVPVRDSR